MKLIKAISEMERELMRKRPNEDWTPVRWTKPHGYLACRDGIGAVWYLHPESLGVRPWDLSVAPIEKE